MDTDLRRSPTLTNRLRAGLISLAEVRVMAFVGDEEARRPVPRTSLTAVALPVGLDMGFVDGWVGQPWQALTENLDPPLWLRGLRRLVADCPDPQRLGVVVAVAAAEAALPVWAKQRAGGDTIPYTGDYEADEHIYWEQVAWRAQEPQAVIEAARAWLAEPTEGTRRQVRQAAESADSPFDRLGYAISDPSALCANGDTQWFRSVTHATRLTDVRPAICTALLTELQSGPAAG